MGIGMGAWGVRGQQGAQAALLADLVHELLLRLPELPRVEFIHWGGPDTERLASPTAPCRLWLRAAGEPAAPLPAAFARCTLVATYAWDGNAFPGNEYFNGALTASGDPAAACCSTITELANPLVNLAYARALQQGTALEFLGA